MPSISAYAPGKIILFGEHAVVYGRPAIACPVNEVRARAVVIPQPRAVKGSMRVQAPDVNLDSRLAELPGEHPLRHVVDLLLETLGIDHFPACTLRISSTIPVASGMGSSAAIPVAMMRALASFAGKSLSDEMINELVYSIEQLHHGTPSGIDNTVITYSQPVYFIRGEPVEFMHVNHPLMFVVGDSGVSSPTSVSVGDVRVGWLNDTEHYESLFDQIGGITSGARQIIEGKVVGDLGELLDANHELLSELGVSSPELDTLVRVAREAGALGAKLSGGGRGGNMIALVKPETATRVAHSLLERGAVNTIITTID